MTTLNEPRPPSAPLSAGRSDSRQDLAILTRTNHDMRSPLSVILGVFELLEDMDGLGEGERRYLALGLKAAEDLLTLADGLRLYSALERNLVSVDPIPMDLLAAALEHVEPACGGKGMRIVIRRDGAEQALADEGYLRLALTALARYVATNLLDDVAPQSELVLIQQRSSNGNVALTLRAGPAAPAAVVDNAEPRSGGMDGSDEVALLNALRLIEMMGGSVVMGRPGTLLQVTLPAA